MTIVEIACYWPKLTQNLEKNIVHNQSLLKYLGLGL